MSSERKQDSAFELRRRVNKSASASAPPVRRRNGELACLRAGHTAVKLTCHPVPTQEKETLDFNIAEAG